MTDKMQEGEVSAKDPVQPPTPFSEHIRAMVASQPSVYPPPNADEARIMARLDAIDRKLERILAKL